jgi:RNA polymerase sigma-70 factor (ECF subfamily)
VGTFIFTWPAGALGAGLDLRLDGESVLREGGEAASEAGNGHAALDLVRTSANAAMERYAGGDDEAFSTLYDALAPRLHHFLVRQCRDDARAEDLLQQTMLQIHRARGRFLQGADVMPWAFAIARRLFIDSLRRGKKELPVDLDAAHGADLAASGAPADDLLHSKQMARAIERELARLPEAQRVAFELIKREGLSVKEAAEILGTTVTAIKLRAHRAYTALRAALGDKASPD